MAERGERRKRIGRGKRERRGRGGEHEPGDADFECFLHRDEVGEYPQRRCGCRDHDQQPKVQLRFRPVISPPSFPNTDLGRHVEVEEIWRGGRLGVDSSIRSEASLGSPAQCGIV